MKIKNEVLEVIKQGILSEEGNTYYLPDIQLDRKLYVETNKVLEGLGFKWNKKEKAHISSEDISEKWYNMIDTGEWVDVKKEFQYFPTPNNIVRQMMKMVDFNKVTNILEPSAGRGAIAFEYQHWCSNKNIDLIELEDNNWMYLDENYDKYSNNKYNLYSSQFHRDFMSFDTKNKYSLIIANPPFTKLQSIKHFNKMVELLADDGQLLCILPDSDYDKNSSIKLRQEFTKFVDDNNCEVTYLDNGDFKESGTMVKTIIVKYVKGKV